MRLPGWNTPGVKVMAAAPSLKCPTDLGFRQIDNYTGPVIKRHRTEEEKGKDVKKEEPNATNTLPVTNPESMDVEEVPSNVKAETSEVKVPYDVKEQPSQVNAPSHDVKEEDDIKEVIKNEKGESVEVIYISD